MSASQKPPNPFANVAGLSKAKLKRVASSEKRDASKPRINNKSDIGEKDVVNYQNVVIEANIEAWEEALKSETFATVYLPLSTQEAGAFLAVNEAYAEKKQADQEYHDILTKVEEKLQALMDKQTEWNEGVFVKTSSRSAKDATIAQERLLSEYKSYLRSIAKPPYPMNERIIALLHAGTQMLKCATAKDAMSLLTTSERIEQDMRLALDVHKRTGEWTENLVVRQWVTIDVSQEWRCFVHERKVTAVSQYNYLPVFDDLLEHREYLERTILDYLNNVCIPALPADTFKNMVIDLALTGDVYKQPKLWVIELNPFLTSTDGALFSWAADEDVIFGRKPFEFRLNEKRSEGVKTSLVHEWRKLVDLPIDD